VLHEAVAAGGANKPAGVAMTLIAPAPDAEPVDPERRFGGLRRLYGDASYARLRAAHIVVVGVGGVGSWAAEALARSGVAALTLIDLDHVSESNINRQVQALGATLGQAKVEALRLRIADIHPGCAVTSVEAFVEAGNWPQLLQGRAVDAVIDACDEGSAKAVLAAWALRSHVPLVIVGAAGGKREPQAVAVDDLALATHDPVLAALRQRLRRHHGAARTGRIGLRCVYSRESVRAPINAGDVDGSLNCHGYGSSVAVTATFGMVAASAAIEFLTVARPEPAALPSYN
jgi:tRNA A37 threonylcarbamoyladenosine dehydratase